MSASVLPNGPNGANGTQVNGTRVNGTHVDGLNAAGAPPLGSFLDANALNDELARILEATDKLRALGIDRNYDLPQIIVCGAQSSGKSSVLEAITEIPFPRSEQTCTKYVTKVTVADGPVLSVKVKIQPDEKRPAAEVDALRKFKKSHSGEDWKARLGIFITEASNDIFSSHGSAAKKLITRDILLITISGPKKQPLQLLDLPGLINYDNTGGGNEGEIKEMVKKYMKMPQSIILAVVKATDDLNAHEILRLCEHYDREGRQTVGVITRPDVAEASQCENLIKVVRKENPAFSFKHNWHVLRNRNAEEVRADTTQADRDMAERIFFDHEPWNKVNRDDRGIDKLRERLRQILLQVNRRELPVLRDIMIGRLASRRAELSSLGGDESEPEELQRVFDIAIRRFQDGARDHARGFYDSQIHQFGPDSAVNLRARVYEEDEVFWSQVTTYGQSWRGNIRPAPIDPDGDLAPTYKRAPALDQVQEPAWAPKSRKEMIADVADLLNRKRGSALPGFHDPARINDLFWKMSDGWQAIAEEYINRVHQCCKAYFEIWAPVAFGRTPTGATPDGFGNAGTLARRLIAKIMPQLEKSRAAAQDELRKLEGDRLGPAKDLSMQFLRDIRAHRHRQEFSRANRAAASGADQGDFEPSTYAKHAGRFSQQDHVEEEAERFIEAMCSYYLNARDQFIANVETQVIERHFLSNLEKMIPERLDFDVVKQLVREDDEQGKRKAEIKKEIHKLDEGIRALGLFQ